MDLFNEADEEKTSLLTPHLNHEELPGGGKDSDQTLTKLIVFKIALVLVTLLLIISGFCLLMPFFPVEAKKKGLTTEEISTVFASYQVMVLLMSLTCGLLVSTTCDLKCMWLNICSAAG